MLNSIKLKLGLIKRTDEEIIELLYGFHITMAQNIIEDKICNKEMVEEQKAEVLLFLWLTSGVPFLFNCKNKNFKNILDNNIYDIIFGRLKNDYSNEVFDSIYISRRKIYSNLLKSNLPSLTFQDYLKITNKFLFETPFEETTEEEELTKLGISFDFIGGFNKSVEISNIIEHILPAYSKVLKRFSKMTKK